MGTCNHTQWLSMDCEGKTVSLYISDRVQTLTSGLSDPDVQRPTLLALVGNCVKSVVLREAFGVKPKRAATKRAAGEVHLHLDAQSSSSDRPIFIAESDFIPAEEKNKCAVLDGCHDTTQRALIEDSVVHAADGLASDLYSQMLFQFVDVFCFFVSDLGGFKRISRHISKWKDRMNAEQPSFLVRPSVVIVVDQTLGGESYETNAKTIFLWLLKQEFSESVSGYFSGIEVVAIPPSGKMSRRERYRYLRERILGRSNSVRKLRVDSRLLFSATHFAAFLHSAWDHFCRDRSVTFDLITASRKQNPVPQDLEEHLATFLDNLPSAHELIVFAAKFVASSFLLDSYPPSAHSNVISYCRSRLYCTNDARVRSICLI
jgi:hypothetical protein